MPDQSLLAVENLRVHFWTGSGTVHAVNGISFEIGPGETLGIVGESGCGKSVTALALLKELVAEERTALILITHDLGVVAGMCERVNVMYAGMFMETGSAEQLFGAPRHPYTLGLLQSVPRLDAARRAALQPIEGAPRDMLRPPSACPFQPRCRYEVAASREEVPPLLEIEPGHSVACFNPVPAEEWERTRAAATA